MHNRASIMANGDADKKSRVNVPLQARERGSGSLERALGKGGYHQTVASAGSTGFSAWENSEFNVPNI